jgi:non-homologous end joining protein Ku
MVAAVYYVKPCNLVGTNKSFHYRDAMPSQKKKVAIYRYTLSHKQEHRILLADDSRHIRKVSACCLA